MMDEKFLKIFRDDDMMHDIPEYQANVEKEDYLSRNPLMDTNKISPENRELFQRVKYNYAKAWSLQSVITLKRKSLKNFSPLSPVRMIATRMEIIVLSAVARLIEEDRAEQIINTVFEVNEDKIISIAEEYAKELGKDVDDLTEEEVAKVLDIFADRFLAHRMKAFQHVYKLPRILKIQKKTAELEDYDDSVNDNRDKKDYVKKTYHTRVKAGSTLSLDEWEEAGGTVVCEPTLNVEAQVEEISEKEWDEIFMSVFNEEEQKIYSLMKKNKTQEEIAKELGYQTQSAISKKKKVMLEKVHKEIDKRTKV